MSSEEQLTRMEQKIDKLDERLDAVDITLIKQHISLDEHIKRTNMLEEKMIPVERHVFMVDGALKALGLLAAVAAIVECVLLLFGHR